MEFIILFTVATLVFLSFMYFITNKLNDTTEKHNWEILDSLGKTIHNEISIAESVKYNYQRKFTLPKTINSQPYTITLEGEDPDSKNILKVSYNEGEIIYINLPFNVTGEIDVNQEDHCIVKNKVTSEITITIGDCITVT